MAHGAIYFHIFSDHQSYLFFVFYWESVNYISQIPLLGGFLLSLGVLGVDWKVVGCVEGLPSCFQLICLAAEGH